jgi:hypothetical protein
VEEAENELKQREAVAASLDTQLQKGDLIGNRPIGAIRARLGSGTPRHSAAGKLAEAVLFWIVTPMV